MQQVDNDLELQIHTIDWIDYDLIVCTEWYCSTFPPLQEIVMKPMNSNDTDTHFYDFDKWRQKSLTFVDLVKCMKNFGWVWDVTIFID